MIAFRTIDWDGDIWSERAFLFKDEETVEAFFNPSNIKLITTFTEAPNREVSDFKVHRPGGKIINTVQFRTEYAGLVRLVRMYDGVLI